MYFQRIPIKKTKFNLLFITIMMLLFSSCTNEDNEIYIDHLNENSIEYINMELEILDLVNNYRSSIGLNSLERMNLISKVAESHSNFMAETGRLSHENFPKRNQELMAKANAKAIGENLGFGYTTAKSAFQAWLNSDKHKKVIEDKKYTHFGISIKQNAKGKNFFTHIFIIR